MVVTSIEHHKLGFEENVTKDVDALAHVRLDASKTICSIGDLSVSLALQRYARV